MSTKTHKKLCWNCDGYVHIYEMQCPYCGANLTEYSSDQKDEESPLTSAIEQTTNKVQSDYSEPPYGHFEEPSEPKSSPSNEYELKEEKDLDNPLATLLLLLPGSVLFLLGLTIILFSADGYLTFRFKAKFWFVYLIGSLPLLYFGYKTLFSNRKEEDINAASSGAIEKQNY